MADARPDRGRAAALAVAVAAGALGARVAATLATTLAGTGTARPALIGTALALLLLAVVLGTARATGSATTTITRRVATAALPLAIAALLPLPAALGPPLDELATLLVQPVQTPSGTVSVPSDTAARWIAAGLAVAALGLGAAWAVRRAWRVTAPPSARALVLLSWALLAPLGLWRATVSPAIGDEPHYLVIAESLLHDGDVDVTNNYDREALARVSPYVFRPVAKRVHVRAQSGETVSMHSAGLSVLVLPAWAAAGRWGVAVLLTLLAALLATWLVVAARRLGLGEEVARTAWAVGGFLSPIYVFSPLLYPEPVAACAAFGAFTVALRAPAADGAGGWRDAAAGAALGAIGFLHVKFLLLGATVLAVGAVRGGWHARARLLPVATAGALAGLASVVVHLRVHDAINPYGGAGPVTFALATLFGRNPVSGAIDLLVAPQGLLTAYPLLAFAPLGAALLLRHAPRRAWQTLAPIVPFFLLYCPYAFWHGSTVPPARMLLPVTPWVVLAAALGIAHARRARAGRVLLAIAGTVAGALSLLGTAVPSLWLSSWLVGALSIVLPAQLAPTVVTPLAMPGLELPGLAAGALALAVLAALSWRASGLPAVAGDARA